MSEKKKFEVKLIDIVLIIILIIIFINVYKAYKSNDFNDFVKAELYSYESNFERDSNVKYSNMNSYKISSEKFNDAMLYKTIEVTPNTAYKVTCMVKTENVITKDEISNGGANISIADTVEKSRSITGTQDWQKLEFKFNSKSRTSVDVGFRLGGYDDNCTGTAWFSDFTIESGTLDNDNVWNFACFVIPNLDVYINQNGTDKEFKLSMTDNDINDMKQNMQRFKTSCQELSANMMEVEYDFYVIQDSLTSLSWDEENGYFVAPKNVYNLIDKYIQEREYDHIFVCVRFGDMIHQDEIKVNDWIGLGGMDYLGIGFSNIRLPNSDKSYIYKYDLNINTFPEEVFVHEFLHSLERTLTEYGYEIPALHDNEKYGYRNQRLIGLRDWYQDYMRCNIQDNYSGKRIGLNQEVYTYKPMQNSNFNYTYDITKRFFKEPENIIDEIKHLFNSIGKSFSKK